MFSVIRASTLREARALLAAEAPAILVTDLGLPDGHGLELIREARARSPAPEILVISVFCDEDHVLAAITAGAGGYLLKDALPQDIVGAVQEVLRGNSPLSPAIARLVLRQLRTPNPAGPEAPRLTPREVDILHAIAKGLTYQEVAASLGLSSATVPNYVKSIYRKLQVTSRGEAVYEALQQRLIRL
jgi:DNA-binding NarL/FixJ family response regulator